MGLKELHHPRRQPGNTSILLDKTALTLAPSAASIFLSQRATNSIQVPGFKHSKTKCTYQLLAWLVRFNWIVDYINELQLQVVSSVWPKAGATSPE